MALAKRITINRYLHTLLIHMLHYEVVGLDSKVPSKHAVRDFIYNNLKRGNIKKDRIAFNTSERIRKDLLTYNRAIFFPADQMDLLVQQISKLDKIPNWQVFVDRYNSPEIIEAIKYLDVIEEARRGEEKLHIEKKDFVIETFVRTKILELHKKYILEVHKAKNETIVEGTDFLIRLATKEEIEIAIQDTKNHTYSIDVKTTYLKNIYEKNKKICFVYIDQFGIGGMICFLPLKSQTYNDLLGEYLSFKEIKQHHVHNCDEKFLVSNIYVHSAHYRSESILLILISCYQSLLKSLTENKRIKILAIGKSDRCKYMLKKNKLSLSKVLINKSIDTDTGQIRLSEFALYEKIIDLKEAKKYYGTTK